MPRRHDPRDVFNEWRRQSGKTLTEIADEIGWTREQLSYVANKRKTMSKKLARSIEREYDLRIGWHPNQPVKPAASAVGEAT